MAAHGPSQSGTEGAGGALAGAASELAGGRCRLVMQSLTVSPENRCDNGVNLTTQLQQALYLYSRMLAVSDSTDETTLGGIIRISSRALRKLYAHSAGCTFFVGL